jgi:FkbM family methyltransferase
MRSEFGYYAFIEASLLGKQAEIYAVEPDPRNLELLSRGIQDNGYGNQIRIIQGAFGNETRDATLNLSTKSNCSRIEAAPEFGATGESVSVDMYAVDEFLTDHGLQPNDLDIVRMDVEGYEANILEGMDELLAADSSLVLFIELHRRLQKEGTLSWTVETLQDAGFEIKLAVYEPRLREPECFDNFNDLLEIDWGEKENIELILVR